MSGSVWRSEAHSDSDSAAGKSLIMHNGAHVAACEARKRGMHAVDPARLVTQHARYLLLQRCAKLHCEGAEVAPWAGASRNHAGSDTPTERKATATRKAKS